eukprot:13345500-Alexandrium_andersonii.AAC.1
MQCSDTCLCICETHLVRSEAEQVYSRLKFSGRTAFPSHAELTMRSEKGTHGGEVILPLSRVHTEPVDRHVMAKAAATTAVPQRWAACVLRLASVSVLLVEVYMQHGIGATGRNLSTLAQLS